MAVLLVRHAEAGDRGAWEGPDELRPLTDEGRGQAERLVDTLARFEVARVLSSPYLRCTQTVAPLAAVRGLAVERSDDLAEGEARAALAVVRGALADVGSLVLCTHGDVVEEVLDALRVTRAAETDKGATWALAAGQAAELLPPP